MLLFVRLPLFLGCIVGVVLVEVDGLLRNLFGLGRLLLPFGLEAVDCGTSSTYLRAFLVLRETLFVIFGFVLY